MPFTFQLTSVFVDPDVVAVKCCVLPSFTVAYKGLIVTYTVSVEELLPPPPHPLPAKEPTSNANNAGIFRMGPRLRT
jgi:hypothetical protein